MSNIAELHILKTRIQELEQDVRISLSRQEIKLHDRLYVAALAELVCLVADDAPGKEYMQSACDCAKRWADVAVKGKK
jgi:hypothetical protein